MAGIEILRHNYLNIYVNSFVLTGKEGTVWIDSGLNGNAHLFTPYLGNGPQYLVATHGHWDHIGLHSYLVERGAAFYAHDGDSRYLSDHAWHWQDLFGQYREDFDLPPARQTTFDQSVGGEVKHWHSLADGQRLTLGDRSLMVYHTPGHSDGSVCLLEEETGALFTGDSLMGTGFFTGPPQYTDPTAYRRSMQRLKALTADTVYSCHNDPMSGKELAGKAQDGIDMTDRTEQLIRARLAMGGAVTLRELVQETCEKLGKSVGGGACVTVMAHLRELAEEFPQVVPILNTHMEVVKYV